MSEKGKKNKKKTGLGLAIWILAFLIILIIFLVKQEEIKENFEKSGAGALIEKKIGKDIFENKNDSQKNTDTEEIVIDLSKNLKKNKAVEAEQEKPSPEKEITKSQDKQEKIAEKAPAPEHKRREKTEVALIQEEKKNEAKKPLASQDKAQAKSSQAEKRETAEKSVKREEKASVTKKAVSPREKETEKKTSPLSQVVQKAAQSTPQPAKASTTIKTKICFVAIDSDGPVVRKEVTRSVEKESPMGDALKMLLAGPNSTEEKIGCRSLIPVGTRLLSASVKNGIATLNFSEEFQFNQFGVEGSLAQLMQVVYTATNFSTVKAVQILIEGQKRDYLTEGVWIGSPLNRSSF